MRRVYPTAFHFNSRVHANHLLCGSTFALGLALLCPLPNSASAAPVSVPARPGMKTETPAQHDARMKWWREARFGMFIHWGLYSQAAGEWAGKDIGGRGINVQGYGEWLMHNAQIPVADYATLAPQFNPTQFNAEAWVSYAKAAGMKYIVVTAKHHDGFAMYPSKVDKFNLHDATPFKRDPLAELAVACRKQGIKFGIYYSQNLDWSHPGGGASGKRWDKAQEGDFDSYVRNLSAPQVDELITHYKPAVLWWDIAGDFTPAEVAALTAAFPKDPALITNDRLGGGVAGDTSTPEQYIPATGFPGRDWEVCMTMNDTWGYKRSDNNYKSSEELTRNLIDIASKGGNYLLNIGPTGEGVVPAPQIGRLKQIGQWMKANGEAIYGTAASPFKYLSWGRATRKQNGANTTLYLHVFNWPTDGKLVVPGLKNAINSAYTLVGHKAIPVASGPDGITLTLPAKAPDPVSSTLVLKFKGAPEIAPTIITANAAGVFQLNPFDSTLRGSTIQVEAKEGGKPNIGYWTNSADAVEWSFKVTNPGRYKASAEVAGLGATTLQISVGTEKLTIPTPATGDYDKFQPVELGTLNLPAGDVTLRLQPGVNWQPLNLRSLKLEPAQ